MQNNLGDFFKNQLNDLDKIPNDTVWKSVEKELDKKEKKKLLIIYFLGFISLLSVALFFYFNKDEITGSNSKIEINNSSSKKTEFKTILDTVYKNKNVKSTKTSSTKKLISTNDEYDEYEIITRYKVYKKTIKIGTIKTKKQQLSNQKLKLRSNKTISSSFFKTKNIIRKSKGQRTTKQFDAQKSNIEEQKESIKNLEQNIKNDNNLKDQNLFTDIPIIPDSIFVTKDSVSKKEIKKIKKPLKKEPLSITKPIKELRLFLTIYAGKNYYGDFNNKSALITGNQNIQTSGDFGNNFGIMARFMFSTKLGFRIGFGYSVWNYNTTILNGNNNNWILDKTNIALNNLTSYDEFNSKFVKENEIELSEKLNYYEIPSNFIMLFQIEKKSELMLSLVSVLIF